MPTIKDLSLLNRVVLSACSPVFKEILRSLGPGDAKGPLIFLRGISYHEMEAVLEFMYNGQTKVQHKELDAFLAAAEELKFKLEQTRDKIEKEVATGKKTKKQAAAELRKAFSTDVHSLTHAELAEKLGTNLKTGVF